MINLKDIFSAQSSEHYAFFFDVDGTLAEIQPHPDDVFIETDLLSALSRLTELTRGAVALVSGRPVVELDKLVAPLMLPLAGIHGAERRDASYTLHQVELPATVPGALAEELSQMTTSMPGIYLENKGVAWAVHYRQAPEYAESVMECVASMVERYPSLTLQPGKCVVEIKPAASDKGSAISAFMSESPFCGRTPVFLGDDLTDERGFLVVNAMQGISVKIGEGDTEARYRLQDIRMVREWLIQLVSSLHQPENTSIRSKDHESLSRRI